MPRGYAICAGLVLGLTLWLCIAAALAVAWHAIH
jgi:hypothetical protein